MINSLIWFPLNGTLDDIEPGGGLLTQVEGNTNPNYNINGKIGKCLLNEGSFKFSDEAVGLIDYSLEKGVYSISIWVKFTENRENYINNNRWCFYFGNAGIVGGAIGFWVNGSEDYIAVGHSYGETGVSISKSIFDKQWHNICFIVKDRAVKVYIDGDYQGQNNISANNPISGSYVYFNTNGIALNDLCLYNHCLSTKEIKEINKCLIAQYYLDNNGYGNDNLLSGTDDLSEFFIWSIDGVLQYEDEESDNEYVKWVSNLTGSTNSVIYSRNNISQGIIKSSNKYTLSFIMETNSSDPIRISIRNSNWINFVTDTIIYNPIVNGNEEKVKVTLTTIAASSNFDDCRIFMDVSKTAGTFYGIRNLKLERGEIATPWCPNKDDLTYNSAKIDTEIDVSGYSHNGVKNNVSYTSDVKRGWGSTSFLTNSTKISRISIDEIVPQNFTTSKFTVSSWVKFNPDIANARGEIIAIGIYPHFFRVYLDSDINETIINVVIRNPATNNIFLKKFYLEMDRTIWHLISITFNNGIIKVYCDKLQVGTSNLDITELNCYVDPISAIGNDTAVTPVSSSVQLSNVRVYLSVLSDADVLDLYKTAVAIDDLGNLWVYGHSGQYQNPVTINERGIAYADNWHISRDAFNIGKNFIKCYRLIYM